MLLPIDKLNTLNYEDKITDVTNYLDDYFEVMPVDEERKDRRKQAAFSIRDALIFLIVLMRTMAERDAFDYEYVLNVFRTEFTNAIIPYVRQDVYILNYINEFTKDYLDHTIEHLSQDDAGFFWSDDRATIASANEGNAVVGYEELEEAIDDGYTQKRWITQRDNRVRATHREVDGKTIPINDYFIVGGVAMLCPCDPDCPDNKETAGCRCALEYL